MLLRLLRETLAGKAPRGRASGGSAWVRLKVALLKVWVKAAPRPLRAALVLAHNASAVDDLAGVRLACETILKSQPWNTTVLQRLVEICLQEGDVQAARELYARVAALEGLPQPRLYRNAYMDPARAAAREPYVHTLHDVVVETERCAIFDDARVYIRETSGTNLANHSRMKVRAAPQREYFLVPLPEPEMTFDHPIALIGTDGENNYGHWLLRCVLKFALLERAGVPDTLPLLVHRNLIPFQTDLLDILRVPRARMLEMPRGTVIRCRELIVPVLLRNHSRMRIGIDWLRGKVAPFMESADRADDLLYVSRRDSRNHALVNEAELEDALRQRGFRIVTLTGMSFIEQVRTFSAARLIVSPMGAGLTNLMFAPLHAAVLEITNTNLQHMRENRIICEQLGLRYQDVVSERYAGVQTAASPAYYDYYADIDAVMRAVDGLLSARVPAR